MLQPQATAASFVPSLLEAIDPQSLSPSVAAFTVLSVHVPPESAEV